MTPKRERVAQARRDAALDDAYGFELAQDNMKRIGECAATEHLSTDELRRGTIVYRVSRRAPTTGLRLSRSGRGVHLSVLPAAPWS